MRGKHSTVISQLTVKNGPRCHFVDLVGSQRAQRAPTCSYLFQHDPFYNIRDVILSNTWSK